MWQSFLTLRIKNIKMKFERLKFIKRGYDDASDLFKKSRSWDQALSLFKKRVKRAYKSEPFPERLEIDGKDSDLFRDYKNGYLANVQEVRVSSESRLKWYKGERIWIVTHGFSDSFDHDFIRISEDLVDQYPQDLVFNLDWSNIAEGLGPGESNDVCRVATWIRPIAEKLFDELEYFGLSDPTKLSFVGHSLGTLLVAEIARVFFEKYGLKSGKLIAIDPPSETAVASYINNSSITSTYNRARNLFENKYLETESYLVRLNPKFLRVASFSDYFQESLSLIGNNSIAGSAKLAKTCSKTVLVKFNSFLEVRRGHSWLVTLLASKGIKEFEEFVLEPPKPLVINTKIASTLSLLKKITAKSLDALPFDIDKSKLKQELNQKISQTFSSLAPLDFVTLDHEFEYIYDASSFIKELE
jgi:Putative serine esterase (DUF676)